MNKITKPECLSSCVQFFEACLKNITFSKGGQISRNIHSKMMLLKNFGHFGCKLPVKPTLYTYYLVFILYTKNPYFV